MIPTARNYAAQAELALSDTSIENKKLAELSIAFAEIIHDSIHFALPDKGLILNDGWKGLEGYKLKLPYKFVTLEYYVAPEDNSLSEKANIYTKRVIIAWEDMGCINLAITMYLPSLKRWIPNLGYIAINLDQIVTPSNASSIFDYNFISSSNLSENDKKIGEDTLRPAMGVLLEFLEALTCRNVYIESIEPVDDAKNKRRIKAGKIPIYETKILCLRSKESLIDKTWKGGTHASPKQHLRRGHIRRYSWGNIWINNMIVGKAENGVVRKSYEVK